MSDPQYRVTMQGKSRVISAQALAAFCLEICGGGYSDKQVIDAMHMQRKAIETGKLTANINLTVEEVKS